MPHPRPPDYRGHAQDEIEIRPGRGRPRRQGSGSRARHFPHGAEEALTIGRAAGPRSIARAGTEPRPPDAGPACGLLPRVSPAVSTWRSADSCTRSWRKSVNWGIEAAGPWANNCGKMRHSHHRRRRWPHAPNAPQGLRRGLHAVTVGIEPVARLAAPGRLCQHVGQEFRLGKRLQLADDIRLAVLRAANALTIPARPKGSVGSVRADAIARYVPSSPAGNATPQQPSISAECGLGVKRNASATCCG